VEYPLPTFVILSPSTSLRTGSAKDLLPFFLPTLVILSVAKDLLPFFEEGGLGTARPRFRGRATSHDFMDSARTAMCFSGEDQSPS